MANKALSLMVAGFLSCSLAYANSLTEGKEKITRNGVSVYLEPNSKDKQRILNGEFDKTLEKMKKAFKANSKASKAPAPPVSYVTIGEIQSQKGGYETIADGQTITKYDHGGSPFLVATGVIGYGGNSSVDTATFGGSKVNYIDYKGLDFDGDKIIDGWLEIWDLTSAPNESGMFIYTSKSINPGPTLSTSIQIQ
ncbi:YolA family protein [Campylobacter helveticus]|uniref:YolA family protein n=1 Tax=Campylobacter helveticus TaxID=28898 RepID=UPI00214A56AE|nr:YolA family protein [Campylobacter helveticus]MCR2064077.1 YolA family protein [Campylobacter helveticus]